MIIHSDTLNSDDAKTAHPEKFEFGPNLLTKFQKISGFNGRSF